MAAFIFQTYTQNLLLIAYAVTNLMKGNFGIPGKA
jgi:hypothetical protein